LKIQEGGGDGGSCAERKKNDEQAAAVGEDRAAEDAPEHAAIDGAGVRHEGAPEKIKSTDLKIGRYTCHCQKRKPG